MKAITIVGGVVILLALGPQSEAFARGFGAARGGYAVGGRGAAVGGARGGYAVGGRGAAVGGARGGAAFGPYGGFHAGGARGGTYVGPRGTTVQAGRVGGVGVGPYGGVHAGGAQGARVTTPGGRTYTTGSRGGVAVGPAGGVRVGGAHGGAVVGPRGGVVGGYRGGVAVGPYGGVGVGGARVGVVGHGTRYVSPVTMRNQAAFVRTGLGYTCFTPTWFRGRPGVWWPARWRVPNYWIAPAWPAVSVWCGITTPPIVYDYGSNIVINENNVYIDGTQVATAPQYADQAIAFADVGRQAEVPADAEWQPLGVFGMIQGEEQVAQNIFQLAVNKGGVVRGNYYDALADNNLPVYGSVDPKSQRICWSVGAKKDVVFETGLNNLTQDQSTVLVHYGNERTQQMVLVRLEQPKE